MINLVLERFSYSTTETEGRLAWPGMVIPPLATIERPWIPHKNLGGKPSESCIPDGTYRMVPCTRPNGDEVYILENHDLGVFRDPRARPRAKGRYLILIHAGNWVTEVKGCIAPGLARLPMRNPKTGRVEQAVTSSGAAMQALAELPRVEHKLTIRPVVGAK